MPPIDFAQLIPFDTDVPLRYCPVGAACAWQVRRFGPVRSFMRLFVVRWRWRASATANGLLELIPYGVSCARFARMFSRDLEGHAPSWPCTQ